MKNLIIMIPVLFIFTFCSMEDQVETRYTHARSNIRSSKNTKSKIVKTLEVNQKISIIPSKRDWWKVVRLGNVPKGSSTIGYIHKSLLFKQPLQNAQTKIKRVVSLVYDVSQLIGLNINQIKEIVGTPDSEWYPTTEQLRLSPGISNTADWFTKGIGLSVDYHSNENIQYIFVSNDGVKYSSDEILKMANLSTKSLKYSIKIQNAINGSGVTGIHVYKK